MIPVVVSCAALGLALLPTIAGAADLGTLGPTYGIAEPHLLNFIEEGYMPKTRLVAWLVGAAVASTIGARLTETRAGDNCRGFHDSMGPPGRGSPA